MRYFLTTMALMVILAVPTALNAQCAVCSSIDQPLGCKWGPYKNAWTTCVDIGSGCDLSGSCGGGGETLLDLDGRIRRPELLSQPVWLRTVGWEMVAERARPDLSWYIEARDCRGRLTASLLTPTREALTTDILI